MPRRDSLTKSWKKTRKGRKVKGKWKEAHKETVRRSKYAV